jgi:hypothetical protein
MELELACQCLKKAHYYQGLGPNCMGFGNDSRRLPEQDAIDVMLQHPNLADMCALLLSLVKDSGTSPCGKAYAMAGLERMLPKSEDWLYLAIESLASESSALHTQLNTMEGCIISHCSLNRRLEWCSFGSRLPLAALLRAEAGTLLQEDGAAVSRACQLFTSAGMNTCDEFVEVILRICPELTIWEGDDAATIEKALEAAARLQSAENSRLRSELGMQSTDFNIVRLLRFAQHFLHETLQQPRPKKPRAKREVAFHSLLSLQTAPYPAGVNRMRREEHLHPAEFFAVFGLTVDSFHALPTPARNELLQQHGLF